MTAISQYMDGAFTLKSFKEDKILDGFKLKDCQGKSFDELPQAAQRKIRQTLIPVTNLKNLDSDQVYVIFELYNTSGTNLNAAEIRNAVYRDHPIHQLVYEMGADGISHYSEILPKKIENEIKLFTEGVRNYVYNFKPKDQNRLNAVDFIERYLGYSSCSHPPGAKFKTTSTKDAIRLFYKFSAVNYTVEDLCEELIEVLDLAGDLFHGLTNIGLTKRTFNGLFATTTMVASKLLHKAIESLILDKNEAREILKLLDQSIIPPENQNSGTIWKFQSEWVIGILNELSSEDQQKIETELPKLIKASRKVLEK